MTTLPKNVTSLRRPKEQLSSEAGAKLRALEGREEELRAASNEFSGHCLALTLWAVIRLRRARLLAGEDPHNPGYVDAHPLVREYYGEQSRSQQTDAWKECNKRLFNYYRALVPQLPKSFEEMEPLFLAVICGCNAGLFNEALQAWEHPRPESVTSAPSPCVVR